MPCYLFTYHGYGTWMPDRKRGFVRRHEGVLPANPHLAKLYRRDAKEDVIEFTRSIQELIIDETQTAAEKQNFRLHCIATDKTHVHILVSWKDDRDWKQARSGIKSSLSRKLNLSLKRRSWFSEGASRKRVIDQQHFDHLVHKYLPNHRGLFWTEKDGIRDERPD